MERRVAARHLMAASIGIVLFVLMLRHDAPALPSAGMVAIFEWMAWTQFERARNEWPAVRVVLTEKVTALFASLKPLYQVTPLVSFVEAALLLLAMIAIMLSITLGIKESSPYLNLLFSGIFFIAGTLECIHRGTRLTRQAWSKTAGKFFLGAVGAIVYVLANAAARHISVEINQLDPKYFPSFSGLIALLVTPFIYAYVLCLAGVTWSLLETIALLGLLLVFEILSVGERTKNLARTANIKEHRSLPPGAPTTSKNNEASTKSLLTNLGRSALLFAFTITVIVAGNQALEGRPDWLVRSLKYALILTDYNEIPICGLPTTALQVQMEPGRYSVARVSDDGVHFSIVVCSKQ